MENSKTGDVLFKVDAGKCLKCGLCVKDCAFKALGTGENALPVMVKPANCMRCQHCLAVCPAGAVTFDGVSPENTVEMKGIDLPDARQIENWMKTRRSVRSFRDEDVDGDVLRKVLGILANSPTGCNARGLKFTCYTDRAAMKEFRAAFLKAVEEHRDGAKLLPRWLAVPAIRMRDGKDDMFFRGATGLLIVSCDETAPGVTTPSEDVTIACSNFELIANANGIATCWCGFLKLVQNEIPELLEKVAGIRRTTPFYAMLFGKSAVAYARGVDRGAYAAIEYRSGKSASEPLL